MPKDIEAWQARLASALDVGAVLLIAQDFLGEWTPQELHRLPAGCFPPPMTHADEVSGYALALLQLQYKSMAEGEEMETMSRFFAAAANRLSEICADVEATRRRIVLTNQYYHIGRKSPI
jgi:hypothetical protein